MWIRKPVCIAYEIKKPRILFTVFVLKIRRVVLLRRFATLEIALEAERECEVKDAAVFKAGHAARKLGVGGLVYKIGCILTHKRQTDVGYRQKIGKCTEHVHRVLAVGGEHQMAHQHAAFQLSFAVKFHAAALAEHFEQSGACHLGVVGCVRVFFGKRW